MWLIGRKPWCWKRLRAGGEGGDRGWDGWMVSPTQRTWVWANSGKRASLVAQLVKNPPAMQRPRFDSWVGKIPGRRDRLPTPVFLGFPVAQLVKNPPAMQETWVPSLSCEDPLEEEMATHSSILAWRIPWTEEPAGLQTTGSQRLGHNCRDLAHVLSKAGYAGP